MRVNKSLYTYPILSPISEDYVDSTFDVEYKIEHTDADQSTVYANFILENQLLEEMVEKGQVGIYLHTECSKTKFRKNQLVEGKSAKVEILNNLMRDMVELNGFIVAREDIPRYRNTFNEDFFGKDYTVFNIQRGNILAYTGTERIDLIEEDRPSSINSIMKIRASKEKFMRVDPYNDIVIIDLPKDLYEIYVTYANSIYKDQIMTMIIMPALSYTISAMKDSDQTLRWYRVLEDKLLDLDIDIDLDSGELDDSKSSLEIAQMILQNPMERAFKSFQTLDELDEEI